MQKILLAIIIFLMSLPVIYFVLRVDQDYRHMAGVRENTPTPKPPITPSTTPTIDELIDQEYHNLKDGVSVYNPPDEISMGETATVRLRITKASLNTVIPLQGMEKNRVNQTASIKISTEMSASLVGYKFIITPRSSENKS
jgi:hypothetical protein